jgi:DNA-directed RNA polymerase I subunit RPA49
MNEVYSRDALIPPAEWAAMDVSGIMKAKDDRARVALLPWRRSRWIENKMRGVMEGPMSGSSKRSALSVYPQSRYHIACSDMPHRKLLYHLTLLLNLNDLSGRLSKLDIAEITAKFPSTPSQCLNGVLSRFGESGGKKWTVTEKGKVKLLAWICCLYLCIEGWSIEIGKVAKDLSITPAK